MEIALDLVINLAAALIGFVLGRAWQLLRQEYRVRRAKRFWRPFLREPIQIVMGHHMNFRGYEPSGFIGVGNAFALNELQLFLKELEVSIYNVKLANQIDDRDLTHNLILLGGPDGNAITKAVLSHLSSTYRFGNDSIHEVAIYDSTDRAKVYAPQVQVTSDGSADLVNDCGLIFKAPNPFCDGKEVLIFAGSFGYGTWAGARLMSTLATFRDRRFRELEHFECLIETEVVLKTPLRIGVLDVRKL